MHSPGNGCAPLGVQGEVGCKFKETGRVRVVDEHVQDEETAILRMDSCKTIDAT